MIKLDKEEKELFDSVERGEWRSVPNLEQEIQEAKKIAGATFKKTERMNIRISPKDLNSLKIEALKEGIPYQTLVSSIIHKYLTGRLVAKKI